MLETSVGSPITQMVSTYCQSSKGMAALKEAITRDPVLVMISSCQCLIEKRLRTDHAQLGVLEWSQVKCERSAAERGVEGNGGK
jgi:hypothetical protein